MRRRIGVYFAAGWGMFLAASAAPHLLGRAGLGPLLESVPWLSHFIVKTVLVALALGAMAYHGRSARAFGFRRAGPWPRRLLLAGFGLGLLASVLVLVTPARGMSGMFEGYGLLALILGIWIYSSVTEEIFVRGWYQTAAAAASEGEGRSRSEAIASSAILFGSMHLSLFQAGADVWTVFIIVVFTTLLGWGAAVARERSSSVVPAILVHVLFNVGGFVAGVIYTVASIVRSGGPIAM
jgi:membrane protease YdiL (CAAX protease family)